MRRSIIVATLAALATTVTPAEAIPPLATGSFASDNVDLVATIPDTLAIGAKIIDGYMYVTTTNGVRIYDVSQGVPILTGQLALPHFENESVDTNGDVLLVSADFFVTGGFGTNILAVIDVRNKNLPVLQGITLQDDGHTATCVADCTYAYTSGGEIFDLRDPSNPHKVGQARNGYTHNWNVDATGIAWADGNTLYDASNPAAPQWLPSIGGFGWHNSIRPNASNAQLSDNDLDPGELVLSSGEEIYDWNLPRGECTDQAGLQTAWFRRAADSTYQVQVRDLWDVAINGTAPTEAKPTSAAFCSSHWIDYTDDLAVVGWYEQGTRILDVSNPSDIRQVAYFMPASSQTWGAYFQDVADGPFGAGLYVYTMDFERGIDVFKVDVTPGVSPTVLAPHLNPTSAAFGPSEDWGWACRVPGGTEITA
jgi:hypothetical protein